MKAFLIICLLIKPDTALNQIKPGTALNQDGRAFKFSIVRQHVFRNKGHHPEINRRVVFQLCNLSGDTLVLYGLKDQEIFDPSGYLIEWNPEKKKWVYPSGNLTSPGFDNLPSYNKDKEALDAGKCLRFVSEISKFQVGLRFRRTVYVSIKKVDQPQEIISPIFVLK